MKAEANEAATSRARQGPTRFPSRSRPRLSSITASFRTDRALRDAAAALNDLSTASRITNQERTSMTSRKQTSNSEHEDFTPRSRLTKVLPTGATTIYLGSDLVVVADKPANGETKRPKITVCKCTGTRYNCHQTPTGDTVCTEECVEWECTEM